MMKDTARHRSRLERAPSLEGGFPIGIAARATEAPQRSIHFWSGPAKVITPEVAYAGRGSRKLFSARNFVQIRVTYLLTQRWIPLGTIRALMQAAEKARIKNRGDWFELLHPLAAGRMEILTCTRVRDWKRWTWDLTDPTTSAQNQLAPSDFLRELPDEDDLRRQVMNYTHTTAPVGMMFQEFQNHEDAIVLNLTRVKHGILLRFKT